MGVGFENLLRRSLVRKGLSLRCHASLHLQYGSPLRQAAFAVTLAAQRVATPDTLRMCGCVPAPRLTLLHGLSHDLLERHQQRSEQCQCRHDRQPDRQACCGTSLWPPRLLAALKRDRSVCCGDLPSEDRFSHGLCFVWRREVRTLTYAMLLPRPGLHHQLTGLCAVGSALQPRLNRRLCGRFRANLRCTVLVQSTWAAARQAWPCGSAWSGPRSRSAERSGRGSLAARSAAWRTLPAGRRVPQDADLNRVWCAMAHV